MLKLTKYLENKRKLIKLINTINKKQRHLENFIDFHNQKTDSLEELLKETEKFQEKAIFKLEELLKGETMKIIDNQEYLNTKREYDKALNELFEKEKELHIKFNKVEAKEKEIVLENIKKFNLETAKEIKKITEKMNAL